MFQISDHLADGESIIVNYELADTKDQSLNQHVHLTTETYLVGIADSPDSSDDEEMVSYLRQIQVNHYAPTIPYIKIIFFKNHKRIFNI